MRPSKVIFLAAITSIGGTILARKLGTRVPGFSPNG